MSWLRVTKRDRLAGQLCFPTCAGAANCNIANPAAQMQDLSPEPHLSFVDSDDDSLLGFGDSESALGAGADPKRCVESHPLQLTSVGSLGSVLLDTSGIQEISSRSASPATFATTAADTVIGSVLEERPMGQPEQSMGMRIDSYPTTLPPLPEEPEQSEENEVRMIC